MQMLNRKDEQQNNDNSAAECDNVRINFRQTLRKFFGLIGETNRSAESQPTSNSARSLSCRSTEV